MGRSFDLRSGRNLAKKRKGASQTLQHITPIETNGFLQFYAYDPKPTSHKTTDDDVFEYGLRDAHGNKTGFLYCQSSKLCQASGMQLIKNQCEQERTHIHIVLMLSLEISCLAGYMLTGNRSMFPETDGSLDWLEQFPLVLSPLQTMNQCYARLPMLFEGQFQFVKPITGQTHLAVNFQICND